MTTEDKPTSAAEPQTSPPTSNKDDGETPYDLSLAHHKKSTTVSPIYAFLLRCQQSTTAGTSISHLTLAPEHLNSKGSIHGSVSATIVDWASGNALATMRCGSGVSVDMHVTFLNGAKEGEVVEVKGVVDKLGKRMVSCISRDGGYYRCNVLVFYRRLRGLR
jgi:hypothetical protein